MRLEAVSGYAGPDRRVSGRDRRAGVWRAVAYGTLHPRRRCGRRSEDLAQALVDWHSPALFAGSIAVLALSIVDAFLTLRLMALGAVESNPVMAPLVRIGPLGFAVGKLTLTGAGVVLLVAISRLTVFGRLRVATCLYALLIAYLALILYELSLLPAIG